MDADKAISVLLVEDSPKDVQMVEAMLVDTGEAQFGIRHVPRLGEAFRCLREGKFDVVLLDLSLPDAKGLSSIDEIQTEFPNLPIVVISTRHEEPLAIQAVEEGAQDYLVKGQGDGKLLPRLLRYAIERKWTEQRLAFLSQYDTLTGLANRTLFRDRLNQALARSERSGSQTALMFLDLDHFKAINDTLGYDAGDALLKEVAGRLKRCVRMTDTVARMGGDEFTIILEDITHSQDPARVAHKIIEVLSPPFPLAGHDIFVKPSIGIALFPSDGNTPEELVKYSYRAMCRVKDQGCNSFQYYAAEMNLRATERLTFRSSLHHALERDEFELHYQPQVDLKTGKIIGMEALLRWQLPKYGLLYPDRFIALAEETELITPIGEWVLRTACTQCQTWREIGLPPFNISVNLSARQFRRHDLAEMIDRVLEDSGLDPCSLELELVEGTLMENTMSSSTTLSLLKEMGVRISVDDFGTGYSSLGYLRRFPIDTLKIDRTFVQEITNNSDDAAISKAIIALAHSLRLSVIAEGVEREDQLNVLRSLGCDAAQGFLFSRPLPSDDVVKVVLSSPLLIACQHTVP
jgi:diguanylate cyclase (GGDEF)-like protein